MNSVDVALLNRKLPRWFSGSVLSLAAVISLSASGSWPLSDSVIATSIRNAAIALALSSLILAFLAYRVAGWSLIVGTFLGLSAIPFFEITRLTDIPLGGSAVTVALAGWVLSRGRNLHRNQETELMRWTDPTGPIPRGLDSRKALDAVNRWLLRVGIVLASVPAVAFIITVAEAFQFTASPDDPRPQGIGGGLALAAFILPATLWLICTAGSFPRRAPRIADERSATIRAWATRIDRDHAVICIDPSDPTTIVGQWKRSHHGGDVAHSAIPQDVWAPIFVTPRSATLSVLAIYLPSQPGQWEFFHRRRRATSPSFRPMMPADFATEANLLTTFEPKPPRSPEQTDPSKHSGRITKPAIAVIVFAYATCMFFGVRLDAVPQMAIFPLMILVGKALAFRATTSWLTPTPTGLVYVSGIWPRTIPWASITTVGADSGELVIRYTMPSPSSAPQVRTVSIPPVGRLTFDHLTIPEAASLIEYYRLNPPVRIPSLPRHPMAQMVVIFSLESAVIAGSILGLSLGLVIPH